MVNPQGLDSALRRRANCGDGELATGPAVSDVIVIASYVRRLAVAAYLAGFMGQSRVHTEPDLRGFLTWCESSGLDPLAAARPHIELYLRWLQEVRRYRPSTVSRRMSVVAGFYRTCVDAQILARHADHEPCSNTTAPAATTTATASTSSPLRRGL